MKPEPLKNKGMNKDNYLIRYKDIIFYGKDIKSAVEWLLKKSEEMLPTTERKFIQDKIKEAFEDVMKDETRTIKE